MGLTVDKVMEAALAEANATRPRTSHTRTLADAHLAHRVAVADAEQRCYDDVMQALGRMGRAQLAAEKTLAVAQARARATAAQRSATWARFRYMDDARQVQQMYEYTDLLLSDQYAQYADRSQRPELITRRRMLARELRRRGVLL